MKTIAVINMKGGCAKTTTTVNMAHILAKDYGKKVLVIEKDMERLKAIPANMHLLTANLMVIKDEERQQATILAEELEKVKGEYDYCIIDCPPDINISVINALVAADEVIIPIKIDGYAFDGMDELEEQINNAKQLNPKLKLRGCLVTMFYNRDVCRQGEEWLQNQRYPVFKTHIRRTEKADEVTFTNESLMEYSPRSGAARDYKAFVREYLEV